MITTNKLDFSGKEQDTAYARFRFELISKTEGIRRDPYRDSQGIPTIGIGFNLRDKDTLKLVLDAFGVDSAANVDAFHAIAENSYSSDSDLLAALNAKLATVANNRGSLGFNFTAGDAGMEEMRQVFHEAVKIKEDDIEIG